MQKDDLTTIGFAAVVCLIASLGLAGVRTALKPLQDLNVRVDEQIQILKALRPDFKPDGTALTDEEVEQYWTAGKPDKTLIPAYFSNNVTTNLVVLEEGGTNSLYTLSKDGEPVAYAFPAQGKGLWSTIKSVVGLEKDLATIRGITFFGHAETPGLGGECSKPWFQSQWQGKLAFAEGAPVQIKVDKGKADPSDPSAVDGMSGATITGNGIQKFVYTTYKEYNSAVFTDMRK